MCDGKPWLAPIGGSGSTADNGPGIAILQIWAGNTSWAADVAKRFPVTNVSARHTVSPDSVPGNCQFSATDLAVDWDVPQASQDLVVGIDICPDIVDLDGQFCFAHRALRLGGFLELHELSSVAQPSELQAEHELTVTFGGNPTGRGHLVPGGGTLAHYMARHGFEVLTEKRLPIRVSDHRYVINDEDDKPELETER
ncbi:hypothetical protein NKR23_g8971 [Pleurostoma richardsiae]|uniref:Uncharacterized protein n=1 Tax=Pleurostoma richardsiae TaxID=41990 RepID=A0AA38R6R8_9PEZI|nr:hypothetical protein NKR23_g8971 [Pleurostoma richardsiae]